MSIKEVKDKIISNINDLEDERILHQVYVLLGIDVAQQGSIEASISEHEKKAVADALKQVKNGELIDLDEDKRQTDQWLNE